MIPLRKLPPTIEVPGWGVFRLHHHRFILFLNTFCYEGVWKHRGKKVSLFLHPPKWWMGRWGAFLKPVPDRLDAITSSLEAILGKGWPVIEKELASRGIEVGGDSAAFMARCVPSLIRIAAGLDDEVYWESEDLRHYSYLNVTLGRKLEILRVELET